MAGDPKAGAGQMLGGAGHILAGLEEDDSWGEVGVSSSISSSPLFVLSTLWYLKNYIT